MVVRRICLCQNILVLNHREMRVLAVAAALFCGSTVGQVGGEEVKGQFRRLEFTFTGKAVILSGQAHKLSVRIYLRRPSAVRDIDHLIRIAVDDEDRPVIGGDLLSDVKVQKFFGVDASNLVVKYFVGFGNF